MVRAGLLFWDLIISFISVWSSALAKIFVYSFLQLGQSSEGEAIMVVISMLHMFIFAWLGIVSRGGTYNLLTVIPSVFSGSLDVFLFAAFGRIPAQIVGSVLGVKSVKEFFPLIGHGARLNVHIHHGALTEGVLTFTIVLVSLCLEKKDPKSFFRKTWISSIAKLTLRVLGSNLTGGIMNPTSEYKNMSFSNLTSMTATSNKSRLLSL